MVKIIKDCVGPCPQGCMGSSCPYQHIPVYICDECGDEDVELYEFDDGRQLCENCLLAQFKKIGR